jgi:hypothetical protein
MLYLEEYVNIDSFCGIRHFVITNATFASLTAKKIIVSCAAELQLKLKVKTISTVNLYVRYFRVNGETSILELPPVTTNLLSSLPTTVLNPLLTPVS